MADGPPEPQGDDDAPPPPESSFNRRRSSAFVPTGTVLLTTTVLGVVASSRMPSATFHTYCRSQEPFSACGVPTATNTTSESSKARARSVVKRRRPSR